MVGRRSAEDDEYGEMVCLRWKALTFTSDAWFIYRTFS